MSRNFSMNKLEAIRQWAADKEEPIVCFVNGHDPEVIKLSKVLLNEHISDVLLLGDELEVYELCRIYRLNETLLYGVINPNDHAELEYYVELFMDDSGEEDSKKAAKMVKKPEVLAQLMLQDGAVDLVIEDLQAWQGV